MSKRTLFTSISHVLSNEMLLEEKEQNLEGG
jgi:hypothetical protein